MHTTIRPVVDVLGGSECAALLTRQSVGRIAYSHHDRVSIEPLHYVYDAPWIFGRTSEGSKLLTLSHNSWCAFEVDEVAGMFEWESVVVHGQFSPRNSPSMRWNYDQAVASLRRLLPQALTADDPTPNRNVVFGVHALEISGRRSYLPRG